MADQDPSPQDAVLIKDRSAGLGNHLPDSRGSDRKIIRRAGEFPRQRAVVILNIGQKYIDVVFKQFYGFDFFIPAAVVNDRDAQLSLYGVGRYCVGVTRLMLCAPWFCSSRKICASRSALISFPKQPLLIW